MVKKVFTLLVIWQLAVFGMAQAMADKTADAMAKPKIAQPLPFKIGEALVYEVGFSKFIFSGTIGELTITVANATSATPPAAPSSSAKGAAQDELIQLRAEAVSKGLFPKLFGMKVRDEFIALVNAKDFGLHESVQRIEEGKTRKEQRLVVDRNAGRVIYTERNLADKNAKPKVKESESPNWIQDLLSAVYFLRTQPLVVGSTTAVPISDAGKVYNVDVIARQREEIKVDAGKFKTVKLDVKAFEGRYVKRQGEMFIWVTDDERRLPVRAKIKTSGATVTIDLKRIG